MSQKSLETSQYWVVRHYPERTRLEREWGMELVSEEEYRRTPEPLRFVGTSLQAGNFLAGFHFAANPAELSALYEAHQQKLKKPPVS